MQMCAVIRVWYHAEQLFKMFRTLIKFMPNRVHLLVKEKGHIPYIIHIIHFTIGMCFFFAKKNFVLANKCIISSIRTNLHNTIIQPFSNLLVAIKFLAVTR